MKFNRLLLGIFSLATLTASSMVMPPIASAARQCVCTASQARPFQGQKSRSSVNFSTQGCKDALIWSAPNGVSFNVVQDVSAGIDRVWIPNVSNLKRSRNPFQEKLYIANPSGAQKDFKVCVFDR